MKQKAFFMIFKGLPVVKNCLRPESATLSEGERPKNLICKAKYFEGQEWISNCKPSILFFFLKDLK